MVGLGRRPARAGGWRERAAPRVGRATRCGVGGQERDNGLREGVVCTGQRPKRVITC